MGVKMKQVFGAIALAASLLMASQGWSATLTINNTTGIWSNPVTTSGPTGALQGVGTSTIKWGVPGRNTKLKSKYAYKNTGPVTQTSSGSFLIGQFTHTNGTIWASSTQLRGANLNLSLSGAADGQAFSLNSVFNFLHDETPNAATVCGAGGTNPCGDQVNISLLSGAPLVITQGSTIFTILIDGFVRSLGGTVVSSFMTPELAQTPLYLQASLSISSVPQPPSSVPLPAGGLLLIGAIGVLGALRRRK